uniref:Uncharacterized protein LOC117363387 isoform X3 n=1 Tax=Geotrypetes seraphini TaxID=260995 RepID=A0A6P8RN49_GEOSA|nr:uncharacterized protein LOC117363387 isoform X3 [Geotrypetes seraphini]
MLAQTIEVPNDWSFCQRPNPAQPDLSSHDWDTDHNSLPDTGFITQLMELPSTHTAARIVHNTQAVHWVEDFSVVSTMTPRSFSWVLIPMVDPSIRVTAFSVAMCRLAWLHIINMDPNLQDHLTNIPCEGNDLFDESIKTATKKLSEHEKTFASIDRPKPSVTMGYKNKFELCYSLLVFKPVTLTGARKQPPFPLPLQFLPVSPWPPFCLPP